MIHNRAISKTEIPPHSSLSPSEKVIAGGIAQHICHTFEEKQTYWRAEYDFAHDMNLFIPITHTNKSISQRVRQHGHMNSMHLLAHAVVDRLCVYDVRVCVWAVRIAVFNGTVSHMLSQAGTRSRDRIIIQFVHSCIQIVVQKTVFILDIDQF